MIILILCSVGLVAVAVASFVCGAIYGRNAEAKAIALALRIESYAKTEFVDVIAKVRATTTTELARLKKFL